MCMLLHRVNEKKAHSLKPSGSKNGIAPKIPMLEQLHVFLINILKFLEPNQFHEEVNQVG